MILSFSFFLQMGYSQTKDVQKIPKDLAQEQLDAYNNRDIDAFLLPYADTVKIYNFPNTLIMDGKEQIRQSYSQMFKNTPNLHCELVNKMVMGNTIIDQESITGFGEDKFEAIAIYKMKGEKIVEVYFVR